MTSARIVPSSADPTAARAMGRSCLTSCDHYREMGAWLTCTTRRASLATPFRRWSRRWCARSAARRPSDPRRPRSCRRLRPRRLRLGLRLGLRQRTGLRRCPMPGRPALPTPGPMDLGDGALTPRGRRRSRPSRRRVFSTPPRASDGRAPFACRARPRRPRRPRLCTDPARPMRSASRAWAGRPQATGSFVSTAPSARARVRWSSWPRRAGSPRRPPSSFPPPARHRTRRSRSSSSDVCLA